LRELNEPGSHSQNDYLSTTEMAFVALPPDLRSLCRKLTSTKPEHLPNLLPVLLKDVHRCQGPLSAPQESKSGANSSEAAVLVHKLRTQITALLNGRSVQGRFAATALVKAVIEVGGWECLRMSEPWIQGLLSILQVSWTKRSAVRNPANSYQKRDPMVTKELCVVTLTKIYMLVHKYQTLIREITTPTLPTFATACLQILKPASSSKAVKAPFTLVETIFEAFSTLIPLYPTTLRPSGTQLRSSAKLYLAPTTSDAIFIPEGVQDSSRRLVIRLHMTAAKNGGSEEWSKHLTGLIKEFHETTEQVFRAIQENWESTSGYRRQQVNFDAEPHGGSSSSEQLPEWTGVQAGSERMVGLLGYIAEFLRCGTKVAVTIPISAITDLVARISSIMPPMLGRGKSVSVQMSPAAGREEKDELWTVFPDIQVAILELLLSVEQRLGKNYTPLAQETLDQALRMFESGYRHPELRTATFSLASELLQLCGPTMAKNNVDALALVIKSCCRDLLGSAGQIKVPKPPASSTLQNGSKSKTVTQNADSFLSSNAEEESIFVSLSPQHLSAAEKLLVALFSYLPQHHINSSLRSRMLKTAILSPSKDAQVASVLHPSRDKTGRTPQVILPYLHRQFPNDDSVEVLRFNFRPTAIGTRNDFMDMDDNMESEDEASAEKSSNGFTFDRPFEATFINPPNGNMVDETKTKLAPLVPMVVTEVKPSPFLPQGTKAAATDELPIQSAAENSLKRKNEDVQVAASKRIEVAAADTSIVDPGFGSVAALVESSLEQITRANAEQADSDDESVHLNMDLDSDDNDDEEEGKEREEEEEEEEKEE
jgi:pre-rRNA-processing protein RIX1